MSPACVSIEIGVRVERAFTRGTLYPDCRPPTRPTFRPQLRHRAYTYATPATATHPALTVQHMRPSDRRFRPLPPSARACRPVGAANIRARCATAAAAFRVARANRQPKTDGRAGALAGVTAAVKLAGRARENDCARKRFGTAVRPSEGTVMVRGVGGPVVGCRAEEARRRGDTARKRELLRACAIRRSTRRNRLTTICTAVTTTTIVYAVFFFFFAFFYARDDGDGGGGSSGGKPAVLSRDCSLARFRPQQRARSRFPTEAHGVVTRIMFVTT